MKLMDVKKNSTVIFLPWFFLLLDMSKQNEPQLDVFWKQSCVAWSTADIYNERLLTYHFENYTLVFDLFEAFFCVVRYCHAFFLYLDIARFGVVCKNSTRNTLVVWYLCSHDTRRTDKTALQERKKNSTHNKWLNVNK